MSDFDNIKVSFLYIGLYSMGREWYYPESVVPYHMLRYVKKGEADFTVNDEKIRVKAGDIVYIPRNSTLSCRAVSDTFSFYSVRFITSLFGDDSDLLEKYYGFSRVMQSHGEEAYFEEMYRRVSSDHIAKKCLLRGNLYMLIGSLSVNNCPDGVPAHVLRHSEDEEEKQQNPMIRFRDPRVTIVADYVMMHPEMRFTPQSMAQMVGLSKQRLNTLFKQYMGKTPMVYCREIKLSTAARKLMISTASVGEIAYEVGYEDTNYFIREFKRAFGVTPHRYRRGSKEL